MQWQSAGDVSARHRRPLLRVKYGVGEVLSLHRLRAGMLLANCIGPMKAGATHFCRRDTGHLLLANAVPIVKNTFGRYWPDADKPFCVYWGIDS